MDSFLKDHWIINRCPLGGGSTSNLLRLLWTNKFRVHIKYWPRLWYAFTLTLITAPLRFVERVRFNRKVNNYKLAEDPIFIVGHWRSGTTLMHYLFTQDKSKGLVSNIEVYAPQFFLAFPNFTRKLIIASLPETRPMDEIKINADLPGEEEHSLGAYDKYGYFHSMIFPRNFKTYASYKSFDDAKPKDLKRWKKRYEFFIKKVALRNNNKRMVLKNPANSYRMEHLNKMYPKAKYIHLYRNPYEVFASSIKFHLDTSRIFSLQTWNEEEYKNNILGIYKELFEKIDDDVKDISKENILYIRYEDFIIKPLETMEKVYSDLKIKGFLEAKEGMQKYLETDKDYKPRKYNFSDELIAKVNKECSFIFDRFGYEKLEPKSSA